MKKYLGLPAAILAVGATILNAQQPPVGSTPPVTGGHIEFATPVADFGKAKVGDIVQYTYFFTNTHPSEILEVLSVQPTCGCTTAGDWTRRVEPGKTGTIPIQFNTANYNGPVLKLITITTSDRSNSTMQVQLKGNVWHPIEVTPLYAIMNIPADATNGSATVRIINNLDEPVTLSPPQSTNPSFVAEVKTIQPGKEFQLIVSTTGSLNPGNIQGQIVLKTSSTNAPVLNVIAMANVQPAVMVSPSQIVLPPGPLTNPITHVISIQNNTSTPLVLSDPIVNANGVNANYIGVEIKDLAPQTPGKSFVVKVEFPQGFEVNNQQIALTVNSSRPPQIRVPVVQPPRPAIMPPPAPPQPTQPPTPSAAAPRPAPRPQATPIYVPVSQPSAIPAVADLRLILNQQATNTP